MQNTKAALTDARVANRGDFDATATPPTPIPAPKPAPTPALVIMPLGDSFTAGGGTAVNGGPPPGSYRAPLYDALTKAGYSVSFVGDQTSNPGGGLPANQGNHEGLGGYGIITVQGDQTNPGILDYLQAHNTLATYKPNLILLMAGYNNLYSAAPANLGPSATYAAMQQLCAYIVKTLPSCKLIVSAEVGSQATPGNDAKNELGQLNALLPGLASISGNITDINGCNVFAYDGSDTGPDGLHPNVAGSQAIAKAFATAINAVIPLNNAGALTPTSGGSITDPMGQVWSLTAAGQVMKSSAQAPGGAGTSALALVNGIIYGQDAASKQWWSNIADKWSGPFATLPSLPTPNPTPKPVPAPIVTIAYLQQQIDQAMALLARARAGLAILGP
jgi:lysophospholipase L1-like esterase